VYNKPSGNLWFDGYNQEQCILLDDYDGYMPYRFLLQLLDRYPMLLPVKGSYIHINSPIIAITAEYPPTMFYIAEHADIQQLLRRITQIRHIESVDELSAPQGHISSQGTR